MNPSPFATRDASQHAVKMKMADAVNSFELTPVAAPTSLAVVRSASPLASATRRPVLDQPVISNKDVDALGSELSRGINQTTSRVVQKMTLNRFGELGDILVNVQLEVDKLKPEDRAGVIGWIQGKFTDLRKQLMVRFENAQKAFEDLEKKMTDQIAIHQEWITDLDKLYMENFAHYQKIVETIHLGTAWERTMLTQLQNWPPISADDPDGPMKMQAKQEAESMVNRLRMKLDMFRRLKVITENNGPKIRSQQDTSRTTIQTLQDTITQVIPLIKMEFAMHLQSLDAQRSLGTVNQTRQLANTSLQKSAESAKDAAINSAKTLNTAAISNETLDVIRSRMLETITGIKKIQIDAQVQRETDANAMLDSQKKYLTALQSQSVV